MPNVWKTKKRERCRLMLYLGACFFKVVRIIIIVKGEKNGIVGIWRICNGYVANMQDNGGLDSMWFGYGEDCFIFNKGKGWDNNKRVRLTDCCEIQVSFSLEPHCCCLTVWGTQSVRTSSFCLKWKHKWKWKLWGSLCFIHSAICSRLKCVNDIIYHTFPLFNLQM